MGADVKNGGFDVSDRGAHFQRVRGEGVADREPSEASVGQRLKKRLDVGTPVSSHPAAAMHQNRHRRGGAASRQRGVKAQTRAVLEVTQ